MKLTEDRQPPVISANVNNLIQELQQQASRCRGVECKSVDNCPGANSRRGHEPDSGKSERN